MVAPPHPLDRIAVAGKDRDAVKALLVVPHRIIASVADSGLGKRLVPLFVEARQPGLDTVDVVGGNPSKRKS